MLSPKELRRAMLEWIHALEVAPVGPAADSLANLVTGLLSGQSLRQAALERAQVSAWTVGARQRYKRVAHALSRPWLSSAQLTAPLVRAALALVDAPVPHLAMDTVRCGAWEKHHGLGGLARPDLAGSLGGAAVPVAEGGVHADRLFTSHTD